MSLGNSLWFAIACGCVGIAWGMAGAFELPLRDAVERECIRLLGKAHEFDLLVERLDRSDKRSAP